MNERGVPVVLGQRSADTTIACTLEGASAIEARVAEWRAVLRDVVSREATVDGGLRLTFANGTPLDELARLVAAEQGCCQFFAFAITVDGRGLALEVHAPAEADDVVASLFGAA